jgi:hypothetical protein
VFHVEVRQFPHVARVFNLTAEELGARVVVPWTRGLPVELQDRRWMPGRAKLVIYDGRRLDSAEIGLGRGWGTVTRTATEVTAAVLEAAQAPGRLDELATALAGHSVTLAEATSIAAGLGLDAHAAIWQLLRDGRLKLTS